MSIQSSINQMLSSIANQQLFKGLTTKVSEIKTDTGNITAEQKRFNELIRKHGSIEAVEDAADLGKQQMGAEFEAREKFPGFDDAVTGMSNMLDQIKNTAQTRTKMRRILAEDTQETIAERLQKAKPERSQAKQEFLNNKGGKHR